MEDSLSSYQRRQAAVRRKHERMAQGYVTKLDKKTGTYVQVPDSKAPGFSLRLIIIAALVFTGFKVVLLTGLGAEDYGTHVSSLAEGSTYEKVGAWFMQVDPVTAQISDFVSLVLS